jgi:hypothetical protein
MRVDQCPSWELEQKSLGKATRAVVDPLLTRCGSPPGTFAVMHNRFQLEFGFEDHRAGTRAPVMPRGEGQLAGRSRMTRAASLKTLMTQQRHECRIELC